MQIVESPKKFYESIPFEIGANLLFRQNLHGYLAETPEARQVFLTMCLEDPKIFFNTTAWTFNPRKPAGARCWPFILRKPAQEEVVDALLEAIRGGYDALVEKSRDEGATEIISKLLTCLFLLESETSFLVGSRKEEYVDGSTNLFRGRVTGSPKSIFHKILYTISHLPAWWTPDIVKTHLHIENLDNGSVIDGEATNENFGAGDRRTAVMLDEFGRVEHRLAQSIRDSIADVTDCVIYNSTHFYGIGHPFAKLRFSGKCKVLTLPWYKNPEKSQGLYISPAYNLIQIKDLVYYKNRWPNHFDKIEEGVPFDIDQFSKRLVMKGDTLKAKFIADGFQDLRSPWYDGEEARRDPRDMAMNIKMDPIGSGDMFFDPKVLQHIRMNVIKPPSYSGEIIYTVDTHYNIRNIRFVPQMGRKRFEWWGELHNGRPLQNHNYIVGCDIGFGTGSSNSCISILDVDTGEKVGRFCDAFTPPEELATMAIAICHWIGGWRGRPYLIWESNGGQGNLFDKRRRLHKYRCIFRDTDYRKDTKKKTKKPGWTSNTKSKFDLLANLRAAIAQGVKQDRIGPHYIFYDERSLSQYEGYVFLEGQRIGQTTEADAASGARQAHGDDVIADGLTVLGLNEFKKPGVRALLDRIYTGRSSMAQRRRIYIEDKKRKDTSKFFGLDK